ncbi:MAG: DNA-processing protein DprA [bacterium]
MTEREAYIALNMLPGIGPVTVRNLAQALGSVAAVFSVAPSGLLEVPGIGRELGARIAKAREVADPAAEEARAALLGARIVTRVDAEYPARLAAIHDPPLALYVRGALESRDTHAIAIVGSRSISHYAREVAERLAARLAQCGITIVSGLARGLDTAAHRGALAGGGRTLAVLGGALDCFYPEENRALGDEIAAHGAVLSEYPMGRAPDRTTFPYRNRVVSGLSLGVVVVECRTTSGAMITAAQAMEQGRTVFAVPGRVDMPGARGPHRLLRDGARLVESADDILEELEQLLPAAARTQADASARPAPTFGADEQRVLNLLEKDRELGVDELVRELNVPAGTLGALLIGLEIKRAVRMLPGRRVARVVSK